MLFFLWSSLPNQLVSDPSTHESSPIDHYMQVHYGLTTEWTLGTLDGTVVPHSAIRAWIGLVVVSHPVFTILSFGCGYSLHTRG